MKKNIPRIFCIGRNYTAHAHELHNKIPTEPVIFIKPYSCLVPAGKKILFPMHGNILHHEVEVVVQIGYSDFPKTTMQAQAMISGLGLGLDLTLRDVQDKLKQQNLPWEKAKAFDNSAPIGEIIPFDKSMALDNITFSCYVNDELRQQGNTKDMLFSIADLIIYISQIWKFIPGDLIFTGTPAGVGVLNRSDNIMIKSELLGKAEWEII